ncbi:MAG: hypothetical protein ACON4Z_05555 [Planctomycetota bacterium]
MSSAILRAGLALAVVLASCGGEPEPAYDWRNRDLAWKYGPTTGTAPLEHLLGTGTKRGEPVAEGWRCELRGGKTLTVKPFRLASQHEIFGKAGLVVGLFDKQSEQITTLRGDALTAQNATSTFELDEEIAERVYDLILWYGKL